MGLTPHDLGLPFKAWREGQLETALDILTSDSQLTGCCLPTGAGKSGCYMAASSLHEGRTCILTSTRSLQDQLQREFSQICDVRGMANYPCLLLHSRSACDVGPCHVGAPCEYKEGPLTSLPRCLYFRALARARNSSVVSTSYALYLSRAVQQLGRFSMLVCDEAHEMPDWVRKSMEVNLGRKELHWIAEKSGEGIPPSTAPIERWVRWSQLAQKLNVGEEDAARARTATQQLTNLSMLNDQWFFDHTEEGVRAAPVDLSPYMSSRMWRGADKVILSSATISPQWAQATCGVEADWFELPSPFPLRRRPAYIIPSARLNHRAGEREYRIWMNRINGICRKRRDRAGIIHTVSYERARRILYGAEDSDRMYTHNSRTTASVLSNFVESALQHKAPILVSPSMDTGVDFPGEMCRFQILAKLPFPDTRDPLTRAVTTSCKGWSEAQTAIAVVQAYGRGVRSKEDWCEFFIVDDNSKWFFRRKQLFPTWFLDALVWAKGIPPPMEEVTT